MSKHALQIHAIEQKIFLVRSHKVMLDSHLAALYDVETRILIRNVKRNPDRFPSDFMLQLTPEEFQSLRSQIGILKEGRGQHRKYLPYVFTENGVAMLSSILNSKRAIHVNIQIMRAFTKLREFLATHHDLQQKIKRLERKFDKKFAVVFHAIQLLLDGPAKKIKVKGFGR
jgi:phage regulator Rha-like protein